VAGWRLGRLSLGTHAALFAVAAAWGSGLIAEGIRAFAASSGTPWDPPATAASLTLGAIVVALAFPSPVSPYQGRLRGASRLVLLTLAVWGLCAVLVRTGAWALGLEPGAGTDPGALAALRSAVLAATAVALAWSSHTEHLRSARWLVYPVLAAGILKLGLQDFVVGSPATLVLSFLAYGTALIVAPRLRRGDA
jgi:hypothetical protein